MKKEWDIYRAFLTFLFISASFFISGYSFAAERSYTVQTGTFNLSALSHAKRHSDTLSQKLKGTDTGDLRIVKTAKFYVVRLGRFGDISNAQRILRIIKPLVQDAFILKESNEGDISILKTHKEAPTPDEFYTILIGKYNKTEDAAIQFDMLTKALIKNDLDNLRIENLGEYFDLKMGRFEDYSAAIKFLQRIEPLIPKAYVIKASGTAGQIVRFYTGAEGEESLEPGLEQKTGPVNEKEMTKDASPSGVDTVNNAEKVEDMFTNISAHYYEQNYDKVAELLREGIKKWPDNADLYAWYGATLLNMKSPDRAYEIYKKAVDLAPDVPDYHAGAGYSLLNIYMDRAKASIDAFNKALELDPYNIDALEGLGIVYVSIDKKELAAEISERLRDLNTEASKRLDIMIRRGVDWTK